MIQRCYNEKAKDYKYYGGRGITVCKEWRQDPTEFIRWCEEESNWFEGCGLTLDKVDNDKGYSPDNCRFTTKIIQTQNQRTRKDNTSGIKGVSQRKDNNNKWQARISVGGQRLNLGLFTTLEQAINVRQEAEQKYWIN